LVASSAVNVVMPAPGLFRSQFGSPPHPQSHRPAGAALQAAPTEPQNRAVRRGQRHHSGTGAVGQPLPCPAAWRASPRATRQLRARLTPKSGRRRRNGTPQTVGPRSASSTRRSGTAGRRGRSWGSPERSKARASTDEPLDSHTPDKCDLLSFVPSSPCGENLMPFQDLARCDSVTSRPRKRKLVSGGGSRSRRRPARSRRSASTAGSRLPARTSSRRRSLAAA